MRAVLSLVLCLALGGCGTTRCGAASHDPGTALIAATLELGVWLLVAALD